MVYGDFGVMLFACFIVLVFDYGRWVCSAGGVSGVGGTLVLFAFLWVCVLVILVCLLFCGCSVG